MTVAPSSTDLSKLKILATLLAPKERETLSGGDASAADAAKTGALWHITIIKAGRALTGDDYPAEVLKESLDIFRGLPIYSFRFGEDAAGADPNEGFHHLPEEVAADSRGQPTANLIGQVTDEVWWNEQEESIEALAAIDDPKARSRFLNAHARGALGRGAELDVFGFSIFAEVLKQEDRVAKFVRGNSLDLVTRPAAGGAFKTVVAEAPKGEPMPALLATLRAETSLEEAAMLRVILEEVECRISKVRWGDDYPTPEAKKAELVKIAEEVIGTMGSGGEPDAVEAAVKERLEQAREAIDKNTQEDPMDEKTLTRLVAEQVKAGIKAARAEDEAEAAKARAASPLEGVKAWLESLQGEERMAAFKQLQAMLSGMGAMVESGAGLGADEFAALTAELKAVTEEKDAKLLRGKLAKVVEGLVAPGEQTEAEKELARMREELRNAAITRELDKLTPELGLKDPQAALILADLSGVTVKGMEVAGLRESLDALVKEKPYLVETAAASAAGQGAATQGEGQAAAAAAAAADDEQGKAKATAPAAAEALAKAKAEAEAAAAAAEAEAAKAKAKAEELQALSAASIRESIGAGGVQAIPVGLAARIKNLQTRARDGDVAAAVDYSRIRKKLLSGA